MDVYVGMLSAFAVLLFPGSGFGQTSELQRAVFGAPATSLPDKVVTVPMRFHEAQPLIEVKVNGQGPFKFLFDTGAAGHGRISSDLASRLGLKESGEVVAGDPSGQGQQTVKLVGVDSISIGEAEFRNLELLRRDNKAIIDERRGIAGILGFGLFADCLITLDYPGERFTIEKGQLSRDGSIGFHNPNGVPEITISVGGVEVAADVDSGSMGRLAVPKDVADRVKLVGEPKVVGKASTGFNEFEIRAALLDGVLRVGDQELRNPSIEIFDIFPRANLGGQFLRDFVVAIDLPNQRLKLTRGQPAQHAPKYRVGIMMRRDAGAQIVDAVIPGSPAETAGIKVGDRITHLNKRPMEDLDPQILSRLFGSPEPLRVSIARGEEAIEITVTPAKVDE
jgi:hypothetical protein